MLILTRRPGETLIIELPNGKQIDVTVLEVKGNQVRLEAKGRHDPCVVPRAVAIVESMAALVLAGCLSMAISW